MSASPPVKMKEKGTCSYMIISVLCFAEIVTNEPYPSILFLNSFPDDFSSSLKARRLKISELMFLFESKGRKSVEVSAQCSRTGALS